MAKVTPNTGTQQAAKEAPPQEPTHDAATEAPKNEAEHEAGPEILKKLNPKDVIGGNLQKLVLDGTLKLPCDLYTLIGRAGNIREGESGFGPWVSLKGQFEATRIFDGSNKPFISAECFIPGPAGDLLVAEVRKFVTEAVEVTAEQFKKSGRTYRTTGEFVEMALIIGAKIAERAGGAGYEFTVRPVIAVQTADPLAALRQKMKGVLALPAPKK